jgi:HSP20 family molecular chaperone IbpA
METGSGGVGGRAGSGPVGAGGTQRPSSKAFYSFTADQSWAPAVNLYETESQYIACVDLAGVDKERIDVELDGQLLLVKGHRLAPTEFDPNSLADLVVEGERRADDVVTGAEAGKMRRCRVHVMEIDHGPFSRSIELPTDADRGAITARYREGLLWINVPKGRK